MGSNNQPITLDLDTGSSDLWVATNQCSGCDWIKSKSLTNFD